MKNNFDRTKTATARFSTRAVAMVLFFVMLLTAIGSGSVLSAIAADLGGSFGASVEAIRTAADEALGIAETVADQAADKSADTAPALDFEENEIVRGMKDDLASTGAKADLAATGYDTFYVKGDWGDNWELHNITSGPFEITLAANTTYNFVFVGNNDQFSSNTTISGTTDYVFSRNDTDAIKLKTTIAGKYKFYYKGMDGGITSMNVRIEFPVDNTPDTWTAAGAYGASSSAAAGFFGTAWAADATANDLANTSGNTWSKTWNNVTLDDETTVYYKVVKNHSWDNTSYPSSNATKTIPAGTYDITITYNSSTNNVDLTYQSVAMSTLTVKSDIEHATVTATYNGETAQEGGTISNIPQGAEVRVSVTPDSGYKCDAVTGTYNSSSTVDGTMNGNARSWTIVMPGQNTEVSATITQVTLKKIYFNNSYTLYGSVYAYVYDKSNDKKTYEYLGAYPGKTMNKLDNSNIWYIEVPSDVDYVQFSSGEGYPTGEMKIPWVDSGESPTYNYPKYTAPYGANTTPDIKHGGTWGNYIYGGNNDKRTNEYTVSDGTTMSASNLFTGLTATMYDYYTDGEITASAGTASDTGASGAPNGWIKGIANDEYCWTDNGWKWNPYTTLNSALSAYADNSVQPKYDVSKPLYFGNLNVTSRNSANTDYAINTTGNGNRDDILAYHGWDSIANNSIDLNEPHNAVTCLTGKTLANSTIHYYSAADSTDENGAPMAMFDEDFLSGENNQNKALASILRTSSFPVRKANVKTIYCDLSDVASFWTNENRSVYAYYWNDSGNNKIAGSIIDTNLIAFQIPSDSTGFKFYRARSIDADWDNETPNLSFQSSNNKYKVNSVFKKENLGTWSTQTGTTVTTHTYYEYDSTNGKDNAFITNINKTAKTAKIDYYADSAQYVQSSNDKKGFFPFDYNNVIKPDTYPVSTIYLDVSSACSDGKSYWAHFYNGGTTHDVKMTNLGNNLYSVTNDGTCTDVIFTRNSDNNAPNSTWSNVWNESVSTTVPTGTDKNVIFKTTKYEKIDNKDKMQGSWTAKSDLQPNPKTNGYADSTDHLAHDLGFGMKLTIPFNLGTNGLNDDGTPQTFDFSGDDDLWVFVDDKLVLDLGGAHGRTTGSINFNTKTITAANTQAIGSATRNASFEDGFNTNPNYVHTMTIYYMERGMYDSNLKFGFSFHAIPNQFWIDKKIRTKDIINAGFYASNGQTGNASNQDNTLTQREGRFISKFEASYQNESFTVEHKYGTSSADQYASEKDYTIDNDPTTYTTGADGQYPIKHDLGNAFIGQFTKNDKFSLKEITGSNNKYVYTPVFSVWDQANNNKAITPGGDNSTGYTFDFSPTTTVSTAIENTNIKARFENFMVAHTLTLTKEITNATDTTTPFTIQVLFDFENDDNYIAYPLYCDVDGVRTKLSNTGTIDITAGQILEIEEIPQNAKIQVKEILTDTSTSGYRYGGMTLKEGTRTFDPSEYTTITKGIQFVMHSDDISVNIANKKPDNKYTIKYTYPSYDNLYGNQSYTVSGVFTKTEMDTYLTYNSETDTTSFISPELKKTFVNSKAPYEDNFMQTLSFANSDINDSGSGLGWNNGNYSCEVNAAATTDDQVSVSFKLPYNVKASDVTSIDASTFLVPDVNESGMVAKKTAQSVGAKKISCFDWYVTDGESKKTANWKPENTTFVKAPLIIYDENEHQNYYFQYWSVKKASSYGMPNEAEYTRCYDYEFNLSLFMDTVIVPVYETTWAQTDYPPTTYNMYNRFDPEKQIAADSTNGISIAFLENSRNQYNNGADGTTKSRGKGAAADVIYSDFLLSFNNYAGKEQLNTRVEGRTKAGLVIEAVDYLTGTNANGFDTSIEYRNETNIATETKKKADIKSWVERGASNDNRLGGMAVSQFDVTSLDNKNRIQYYYALNNRKLDASTGNLLNTLQNRYKVFRAYAYIGDVSGDGLTNVKVSDPVYFTIYDMASNGLANNATGK